MYFKKKLKVREIIPSVVRMLDLNWEKKPWISGVTKVELALFPECRRAFSCIPVSIDFGPTWHEIIWKCQSNGSFTAVFYSTVQSSYLYQMRTWWNFSACSGSWLKWVWKRCWQCCVIPTSTQSPSLGKSRRLVFSCSCSMIRHSWKRSDHLQRYILCRTRSL